MTSIERLLAGLCRAEEERAHLLVDIVHVRETIRLLRRRLADEMRKRRLMFVHVAGLPSAMLRSDGRIRLFSRRSGR